MLNEIFNFFLNYWWIFLIFFILFLYSKYKNKETVGELKLKEMFIMVELLFYFVLIYLFQSYFYSKHGYFIIGLIFFITVWSFAINYLLNKDNVYMIESTLQGEKFYDIINGNEKYSLSTGQRILIMDREFYNAKNHIGSQENPLWNSSRNIKFTDKYDDETKIFYHSEYPELHNINLYTLTAIWIKLKNDVPKIMRENITHTVIGDWKTAYQQELLKDKIMLRLSGQNRYYDDKPFMVFNTLDELLEFTKGHKSHDKTENENKTENNTQNTSENKQGD